MSEHITASEIERENYSIVRAKPDDAADIINVQIKTWLATYTNEEYGITTGMIRDWFGVDDKDLTQENIKRREKKIKDSPYGTFIAEQDGEVVGFSSPIYDTDENYQRIGELYILPEAQGEGLGRRLLNEALEALDSSQDIYVQVFTHNADAIRFYEKNGFVQTDKDPSENGVIFKNGVHLQAIEMVKKPS